MVAARERMADAEETNGHVNGDTELVQENVELNDEKPPITPPTQAQPSKISSWFTKTWSKNNLTKAQKSVGDLLARPGKLYRELKEETEVLKKRYEELEKAMLVAPTNNTGRRYFAGVSTDKQHKDLLTLHAGGVPGGILIGTSADEKLLNIQWQRQPMNLRSPKSLESLGSNFSLISESSLELDNGSEWKNIKGSVATKGIYLPSADDHNCYLRAKISFTRQFRLFSPSMLPDTVVYAVADSFVQLDSSVIQEKEEFIKNSCATFTGFRDVVDPLKSVTLEITKSEGQVTVLITKASKSMDETDTETVSAASSDTMQEEEDSETLNFPRDVLRVQVGGDNIRHLRLICQRESNTLEMLLSAPDTRTRDLVILALRSFRAQVVEEIKRPELSSTYDYPEKVSNRRVSQSSDFFLKQRLSSPFWKSKSSGTSVCRCKPDSVISLQEAEVALCACCCVYDAVAEQMMLVQYTGLKRSKRSFSDQGLQLRESVSMQFQSVSSLISTAFDPFALQGAKKKKSIYDTAGFDAPYTIELDLDEGEGLGITLGAYTVGKDFTIVCINEFVPLLDGTTQGKIEQSGKVKAGDAFVAINDQPIANFPTTKGTLKRASQLMNSARNGTDSEVGDQVINGKAVLSLTFARPLADKSKDKASKEKSKEKAKPKAKTKQKAKLDSVESKDAGKEVEMVEKSKYEQVAEREKKALLQLSEQKARADEYCHMMETERANMYTRLVEFDLMNKERREAVEKVVSTTETLTSEIESLQEQLAKSKDSTEYWQQECEKMSKKVVTMETKMLAHANDGEAYENALGTKEEALRALEADLNVLKLRNETLQELLDSTRDDRSRDQLALETANKEKMELEQSLSNANDEADKLLAKLRTEKESNVESLARAEHEREGALKQLEAVKAELSTSQSYAAALKESVATLESRAKTLEEARQHAEEAKTVAYSKIGLLETEIKKASIPAAAPPQLQEDTALGKQLATVQSKLKDNENTMRHLQDENDALRAQLKSSKSKSQSMRAEISKLAKLEKLEATNNDLMVKLSVAEANRMESEDELVAYKRALMQFASQAQLDERNGNGTPWSNRPKIFDHLYKKHLKGKNFTG